MSDTKITLIKKREPSQKDKDLMEFIEKVDELQAFLTSVGKHAELWRIFQSLAYYVGACMKESLSDEPKGNKKGGTVRFNNHERIL